MLKLFITTFFALQLITSLGQNLFIADLPRILYKGIPEKFHFSLPDTACSSISFRVTNGKFKQKAFSIWINPDSVGLCQIAVINSTGNEIANYSFTVMEKPLLKSFIGNKTGGKVTKDLLLKMGGLIARLEDNLDADIPIKTIKYSVLIIRNGETMSHTNNKGARFESNTIELLQKIKKGDIVIFYSIEAQLPNENKQYSSPIELTIEDNP